MDIYEYYQEREKKRREAIIACEKAMLNLDQLLEKHKDKVMRCWSYELDVRDGGHYGHL